MPEAAAGDHTPRHQDCSAEATDAPTGKTTTGTPKPTANATDDHEPEPKPAKQREAEAEGSKPAGHGDETNATRPLNAMQGAR